MSSDLNWQKVEGTSKYGIEDLKPGEIRYFESGKHKLCLVRSGDRAFVVDHKCPHAGGKISKGWVEDDCIVCPLHRYKFSLETGRTVEGASSYLENYPVETREDGLYVGLPKKKFLGLF